MLHDRRSFLKWSALAGAASLAPVRKALASDPIGTGGMAGGAGAGACGLIPTEMAGPFPLDLSANAKYLRQDIREDRAGVPLNLKMKILGVDNCAALTNARVNIWHCDKDGAYSGYDNAMNPGQAGLTYLRGYQLTNAKGEVDFVTIFPGWYPGRTCHFHFQVYVSSAYAAISQFTFEAGAKNALYRAYPAIYTKGVDPLSPSGDGIFNDGYAFQVATLAPSAKKGEYDAYMEVSVQGRGTVGLGHLEREQMKYFTLGQSYPNPFESDPIIPFTLRHPAEVAISFYDLSGKKVAALPQRRLTAGDHTAKVGMRSLGLQHRDYIYQIEVSNEAGVFKEYKLMTAGNR